MIEQRDLPEEIYAHGFNIPTGYRRVFEQGLTNLAPWYFVTGEEFHRLYKGLNSRYPQRLVIPFARRQDCDDVACFVVHSPDFPLGHVLILHDFASAGFEVDVSLNSFWDWFLLAVQEMIECSKACA